MDENNGYICRYHILTFNTVRPLNGRWGFAKITAQQLNPIFRPPIHTKIQSENHIELS